MRALVQREFYSDTVNVYVLEDFPNRALTPNGWVERREGDLPPPLMSLNTKVAEVVAQALNELVPALPATEDALRDTREVRDRLLAIVEKGT